MAARPRRKAPTTEALRKDLASRLPGRLGALLADYEAFAAVPSAPPGPPEDAKLYAAHHAACKAALQHADMLVRLLRWAEGGGADMPAGDRGDGLPGLLARARRAVADDDDGEEDGDDAD